MIAFLRPRRNIEDVMGSALVFQFMYVEKNLFYYKEILHFVCASFRMTEFWLKIRAIGLEIHTTRREKKKRY